MRPEIVQMFPRMENGQVQRRSWTVDLDTARTLGDWGRDAARLLHEAQEMAEHFPRWLLTLGRGRERLQCPACRGMLVFDRGLRCAACQQALPRQRLPEGTELAWFGLLPPIGIDGLARIREGLAGRPPAQHVVGSRPDLGRYLLVPLLVAYPHGFPTAAPRVHYLKEFFQIPGMPRDAASHEVHLYGSGCMCLFAPGEWRPEMSCREVLQQRAYAHVIKLLNYGNGKRDAFTLVS